ncbi:uncharacterized protein LOC111106546 isoform X3 [Crassostrea virginica]|uniref:Uncharacterized protein LOC111106546 isoform X2 n=1 Tax=Crassostrea virginica TaxID=6565 RepID=A0A8B8B0X0_CRAVI|nr:uncharacterized protein LOC111106546 isoform X2 [Crassostrea virginica]
MAAIRWISVLWVLFPFIGFAGCSCTYRNNAGSLHVECHQTYAYTYTYTISGGAIAGAVVGSLFFVAIVAFIICFCCWLRKRNAAGTPGTVARPTGPVIVQSTPGNVPASAQPGPSNPVMQQAYPMTSPNNAHTLRMHTGYDQ